MATPFFDATYYLQNNPDVFESGMDPYTHYIQYGANEALLGAESRKPAPWFDIEFYYENNPDLVDAELGAADLFLHFVNYGYKEGRAPNEDAVGVVTADSLLAYALANPDLLAAFDIAADATELTDAQQQDLTFQYYAYGYYEDRPALPGAGEGGEPEATGDTYYLEVGRDNFTGDNAGKAGDDLFIADVVQNDAGLQVNSLGSGDRLDGGAGNDTLQATVVAGGWAGGGASNQAIMPTTNSIETVEINAQITDIQGAGGTNNDQVFLNARNMNGVEKLSSKYSDGSLTVQNLTSLSSNGAVRSTSDMTIGMEYTGNADTAWKESDMTVFFDQDYLTRTPEETNSIEIRMVDLLDNKVDGTPLTTFQTLTIRQEGKENLEVNVEAANGLVGQAAYDKVVELLNAAFAADPEWEDVTASLLPEREAQFSEDIVGSNGQHYSKGQSAGNYSPILLTSESTAEFQRPLSTNDQDAEDYNPFFSSVLNPTEASFVPVSINVDLEKVGLAADGGGLIIGSMNKNGENVFGQKQGITVTDTVAGFDEFNVHVGGEQGKQDSSLSYLHSTDNTLRKVSIDSQAGSNANLTIGNSNTVLTNLGAGFADSANNADAFKDVQIMDASEFNGNLILNAGITTEIIQKYLENTEVMLYDINSTAVAKAEQAAFEYLGGAGDDVLNIRIGQAALADAFTSTTSTNKNVFSMYVNGGAGDDTIIVAFDGTGLENGQTNITINGGAGNDSIDIENGANSTDATFVIEFDGANFGHDKIIGFYAGVVALTDEAQTLDLSSLDATTGATLHQGETVVVWVGNQSYQYTLGTGEGNAVALTFIQDVLTGTNTGNSSNTTKYFDPFAITAGSNSLTAGNTSDFEGENVGTVVVDILPAGSSVVHADGTYDRDTDPLHSFTATTQQEGGIWSSSDGADVLDFSAYGVKGFVTTKAIDTNGKLDLGGYTAANISSLNAGDQFLTFVESEHSDDVMNVYLSTATGTIANAGAVDFTGGDAVATLGSAIGSIELIAGSGTDDWTTLDVSQFVI